MFIISCIINFVVLKNNKKNGVFEEKKSEFY